MARIRSPNHPVMSLAEAIAKATVIHDRERHLAAPKEVVAKHLGYGGMNGASAKAISALVKYGLLEEAPGEKLKVSHAALSILHPRSQDERAQAIRDAAARPAVFVDISNEWTDGHPSDDNLRAWLVRRNFASDAIERVIKIYRDNVELVARESGAFDLAPSRGTPGEHAAPEVGGKSSAQTRHAAYLPVMDADDPDINNPQIIDRGATIQVSGVVDRKGLDRLIKKLTAYKAVLDASSEDEGE